MERSPLLESLLRILDGDFSCYKCSNVCPLPLRKIIGREVGWRLGGAGRA